MLPNCYYCGRFVNTNNKDVECENIYGHMEMKIEDKQICPNFSFFGAHYPDAGCVDGVLFDLDKCDENGLLYEQGDNWPCPFCRSEAFIKQYAEHFGIKYSDARIKIKVFKKEILSKSNKLNN